MDVTAGPTTINPHVAAIGPTQVRKRLRERRDDSLHLRIVFVAPHEYADAPHAVALLRARRKRPRSCCPAERDYEFSPSDVDCHAPLPRGVMGRYHALAKRKQMLSMSQLGHQETRGPRQPRGRFASVTGRRDARLGIANFMQATGAIGLEAKTAVAAAPRVASVCSLCRISGLLWPLMRPDIPAGTTGQSNAWRAAALHRWHMGTGCGCRTQC